VIGELESECGERAAIDHRCARGSRRERDASRRALERIRQIYFLRMPFERGYHVFREQPHAGAALVVTDRTLDAQYDEDAGAQHAHDRLDLRDECRRRTRQHLHVLLPPE